MGGCQRGRVQACLGLAEVQLAACTRGWGARGGGEGGDYSASRTTHGESSVERDGGAGMHMYLLVNLPSSRLPAYT